MHRVFPRIYLFSKQLKLSDENLNQLNILQAEESHVIQAISQNIS